MMYGWMDGENNREVALKKEGKKETFFIRKEVGGVVENI